jgi:hypothetical protein
MTSTSPCSEADCGYPTAGPVSHRPTATRSRDGETPRRPPRTGRPAAPASHGFPELVPAPRAAAAIAHPGPEQNAMASKGLISLWARRCRMRTPPWRATLCHASGSVLASARTEHGPLSQNIRSGRRGSLPPASPRTVVGAPSVLSTRGPRRGQGAIRGTGGDDPRG